MIDNRTGYLSLPLPHEDNFLEDDVGRLRDALENLDDYARETDASLAAKSDAADTAQIARVLTTKSSISAVDAALSLKADKTAVAADITAAVAPKANAADVVAGLQAESASRQGDMNAVAQSIEEVYQRIEGESRTLSGRIDRKLELADADFRVGTRVRALPYTTQAGLCGYYSTCLNDLGEVLAWGQGNWKQNGSFNASNNAVPMVVGIDGTRPDGPFVRLFMANNVTYALDGSGNVWAFGKNHYGELGQGDTVNRACLKRIEYFATNGIRIVDIATPTVPYPSDDYQYYSSTLFLSDAGKVYGCGLNNYGQLGVGDTATKTTPVPVSGLSDIVRIASNMGNYACGYAVTKAGRLYSWGYNGNGQLGLGNTTQYTTPQLCSVRDVEEVVVGGHFALCRTSAGEVYGAGHNGNGKLGLGDAAQRASWTKVNISGIKKIYAWDYGDAGVSALVTNTGELLMAGYNGYGGLGMGDTTARNAFVRPNAAFQGKVVKALGSGWNHPICVVLDSDGNLWGAGYNAYGQLARGDNTRAGTNNTFQKFRHGLNNGTKVIDAVALGFSNAQHILALTNDGRLLACGYNGQGQLGINATIVNSCEDILRVVRT